MHPSQTNNVWTNFTLCRFFLSSGEESEVEAKEDAQRPRTNPPEPEEQGDSLLVGWGVIDTAAQIS